jgi:hypothetical protein
VRERSAVKPEPRGRCNRSSADVQLRAYPYPYRAMLAICSDLDGTPGGCAYLEIMRFLNTTETTALGPGVGLEVGNSIHFKAIPPQFSYWDTADAGREMIRTLIHSGHIDCLHSFGELVHTREEAKRALGELQEHECRLEVWVDHGGAATNFGSDIMQGHGDEVGHPAYHADLTIGHGVKYVWRGRTTSVTGQDRPAGLGGIFNWRHPVASSRTLLKEATKRGLGAIGNERYAMHGPNELLRRAVLRDGQPVYEFMRCNPHWAGVSSCDRGSQIGEVLTGDMLDRLIDRRGTCILYTHLGKGDNPPIPFNGKAVKAFHHLAQEFHDGRILVTTTRRLLDYRRAIREIGYDIRSDGEMLRIDLNTQSSESPVGGLSAADLSGLTFYVPDSRAVRLTVNGQQIPDLRHNVPDHTGRPSVSLPWRMLEFPELRPSLLRICR